MAFLSPDGAVLEINQCALHRIGARRRDVLGRYLWDFPGRGPELGSGPSLRRAVAHAARGESVRLGAPPPEPAPAGPQRACLMLLPVSDLAHRITLLMIAEVSEATLPAEATEISSKPETTFSPTDRATAIASRSSARFLAEASHDLRQPLHTLKLMNHLLLKGVQDPALHEIASRQQDAIQCMSDLVNSLLHIGRLEAGVVRPDIQEFGLADMLHQLQTVVGVEAEQKGIAVHMETPAVAIRSDPGLIEHILQNLLVNAIRYTEAGSVTLGCRRRGALLRIEVIDTGIGIAADQIEQIFEDFHRVDAPSIRHQPGLGLGLAIVRRLAALLGHPLGVESTPGQGSRFWLDVPIAAQPGIRPIEDSLDHRPGTGTILLADDDAAVAEATRMLLEAEGYRVLTSEGTGDAVRQVTRSGIQPDLIIADYHLCNHETGLDVIQCLRERYAHTIPAIIVTGDTSNMLEEASSCNRCTWLSKPVDADKLLAIAAQFLRPEPS
jgi:signal transduction histidine kinase/CheY-like chemotaxis protein